jgi:hypothetical protein
MLHYDGIIDIVPAFPDLAGVREEKTSGEGLEK